MSNNPLRRQIEIARLSLIFLIDALGFLVLHEIDNLNIKLDHIPPCVEVKGK